MAFLANADALIIDERDGHGGDPEMVDLLCTYHLLSPRFRIYQLLSGLIEPLITWVGIRISWLGFLALSHIGGYPVVGRVMIIGGSIEACTSSKRQQTE